MRIVSFVSLNPGLTRWLFGHDAGSEGFIVGRVRRHYELFLEIEGDEFRFSALSYIAVHFAKDSYGEALWLVVHFTRDYPYSSLARFRILLSLRAFHSHKVVGPRIYLENSP